MKVANKIKFYLKATTILAGVQEYQLSETRSDSICATQYQVISKLLKTHLALIVSDYQICKEQ